ncbi:glycosyl transferase family 2 [Limosilactobacillus reuteri]|uniref:glycosyltransferase family 2 protein n=1 Tax=Limosilactobacillus reuteri TaxID=1598 RepID=UPI000A2E6EA9|nr:glycosyltransferase family 2 protein [Limosilactobacillus reuteri]OTA44624.1 glycosyl transferase family 2 [Limosilactobacillus reuteri]
MDKISIVVPVYNVKQYLKRCVRSIENQTYRNLEIILVDDGSTDGSSEICDSFTDKRIKVIHKPNEGLGLSRNVGIKEATGKYIAFVDSDDYIDKTMISNLYSEMIKNHADTCIGGFKRVFKNKIISYANPLAGKTFEYPQIVKEVLAKMMGKASSIDDHIEMSVWKVLFTLSVIKKSNIKFPSEREFISEDIIFDTEYYTKCKKVCMSSDTGYNYCDNNDSLTTSYNPNRFELQVKLFKELQKRTIELSIYPFVEQRLYNTLIANSRYCIKLEQKFLHIRKDTLKRILFICSNSTLQYALIRYKVNEKKSSKLINKLIKKRRVTSLYYIMWIKNTFNI